MVSFDSSSSSRSNSRSSRTSSSSSSSSSGRRRRTYVFCFSLVIRLVEGKGHRVNGGSEGSQNALEGLGAKRMDFRLIITNMSY